MTKFFQITLASLLATTALAEKPQLPCAKKLIGTYACLSTLNTEVDAKIVEENGELVLLMGNSPEDTSKIILDGQAHDKYTSKCLGDTLELVEGDFSAKITQTATGVEYAITDDVETIKINCPRK
jgi:hypothetical protein